MLPGRETPAVLSPDRDSTRPDGPPRPRVTFMERLLFRRACHGTLLVPAAIAAFLATSATSFAAVEHASGTIKTFDSKAMTLTLASGETYLRRKTFQDPGLKAGERVSIDWEMVGSRRPPTR